MANIFIRNMQESDLVAVELIEQQQVYPWSFAQLQAALTSNCLCQVLEEQGKIIGFAIMQIVLDEGEIINIAIHREHQRLGHGRRLLAHLIELAKLQQVKTLYLEVRASNHAARELYRGLGFTQTGVRKGYYRAPVGSEDAILMQWGQA